MAKREFLSMNQLREVAPDEVNLTPKPIKYNY